MTNEKKSGFMCLRNRKILVYKKKKPCDCLHQKRKQFRIGEMTLRGAHGNLARVKYAKSAKSKEPRDQRQGNSMIKGTVRAN